MDQTPEEARHRVTALGREQEQGKRDLLDVQLLQAEDELQLVDVALLSSLLTLAHALVFDEDGLVQALQKLHHCGVIVATEHSYHHANHLRFEFLARANFLGQVFEMRGLDLFDA